MSASLLSGSFFDVPDKVDDVAAVVVVAIHYETKSLQSPQFLFITLIIDLLDRTRDAMAILCEDAPRHQMTLK